jgi:succinate-semialdehyde dehydrogenase / glutarate-semialdehyde dehydrogenase
MSIATVNPATGETLRSFEAYEPEEVDRRIALADTAFRAWKKTTFAERGSLMHAMADIFEADADKVAPVMTTEMGKTVEQARAEVLKCAKGAHYFADHAEQMLADEPALGTAAKKRSYATYQPLGPVLAVMPWNYPMWQVVRFSAPALMAGNVGLLKHASNVPQTALYLEDAARRAGFPDGVFQTLLVGSAEVKRVLADKRVRAATLTGSEGAGQAVAAQAGHEIKKTVLELGGSDPYIVMPSADIARAVEVGIKARVQNNGQSCIAAKRFIVHEAIADEFESRFVDGMAKLAVGDPMAPGTDVGPLATLQGRDEIVGQVADAVGLGAAVLTGGSAIDGPGWYYPPTVITGITKQMRIYSEEIFGPVATLWRVGDIDEAIALANDSEFGLGANAWTEDPTEQQRFIDELESGMVFVNWMTTSYVELPFGGVKRSGYGRELSAHGIREFSVIKTVWID